MSSGSVHSMSEEEREVAAPLRRTSTSSSTSSRTMTSAASRSSLEMNESRQSSESSSLKTSSYNTDSPRSFSSTATPVVNLPRGVHRGATPEVSVPRDAPRKKRDDFFDQNVSERDYASALDSLAHASPRDDDFRSQVTGATSESDVAHVHFAPEHSATDTKFIDGFKVCFLTCST